MKRDAPLSQLWAVIVSFSLSFGGVSAMVTGFSLDASLVALGFCCAIFTVLAVLLLRYRFGWLCYCAVLVLMLLLKKFWLQGKYLILQIAQMYSDGYGFALPQWLRTAKPTGILLPLLFIGSIVAGVAAWTVLYRRRAFWAVGVSLLPLICCLVVTVTVPANFAIVLLLGAMALLIMTQATRRRDPHQGNRLCAMLSLPILAGLIGLMILVPRESYRPIRFPDWMIPSYNQTDTTQPAFQDKLNVQVDLSQEGYRKLDKRAVMDITTDYSGKLYLRGRHYDVYSGNTWSISPTLLETSITPSGRWISPTGYYVTISYKIPGDYRHIPYYPQESVSFTGGMVLGDSQDAYTYAFTPLLANWQQHWRDLGDPMQDRQDYIQLPAETMDWAAGLATEFQQAGDVIAIAEAVEAYVEHSAAYDLDTPYAPADNTDFARWFLMESDTGYCVHFATAATVLLRAAGVPARYVEGYMLSSASQQTTVRGDMAHAWVEYYVNGMGWVVMDPTPADLDQPETPVTTAPTEPSTTQTTQTTQPTTTKPSAPTIPTDPPVYPPDPQTEANVNFAKLLWVLMGITAAVLTVVGQWLLRRWLKLRKLHKGHPNRQALARYERVKQLAKMQKQPVPYELHDLAEKAKFSNQPLTEAELAKFDAYNAESIEEMCRENWFWHILLRFVFALC